MFILEAQEVSKTYPVDQRRIKVLENISLGVAPGEFVVVTGRSGSGCA